MHLCRPVFYFKICTTWKKNLRTHTHTHTNICFIDTLFVEIENVSSDGLKILFEQFV